jgi:two-component sensor histidine kinase
MAVSWCPHCGLPLPRRAHEVWLREAHHRIKNAFQTLASLLDMQADALADPHARAALEDSQRRIQAMALVHQSLYQSRDLERLDGAAYLRDLATALGRAYAAEARRLTLRSRPRTWGGGRTRRLPVG